VIPDLDKMWVIASLHHVAWCRFKKRIKEAGHFFFFSYNIRASTKNHLRIYKLFFILISKNKISEDVSKEAVLEKC